MPNQLTVTFIAQKEGVKKQWALKFLAATQELTESIKTGCLDISIKTFCSKCPRLFLKLFF